MNRYLNPYLNIKIDFPDTWKFRYWGNSKCKPELQAGIQAAFDDLPSESSDGKLMLVALTSLHRKSLLGSFFSASCFYLPNGFSLLEHRPEYDCDFKREFKVQSIAGVETQSLYLESEAVGDTCYSNYYCWKYSENIWIYFFLRADSLEGLKEVKKVLGQLSNIQIFENSPDTTT